MASKKTERREALREIYYLLNKAGDGKEVLEAKHKVVMMLAAEGLFMMDAAAKVN